MATLPKKTLTQLIDAVVLESYPRPHLGASVIGNSCKRKTAYSFYWTHKTRVPGRLERIFRLGDAIEDQIINALASVGITVEGSQLRVSDDTGHCGGSVDGIIKNHPDFNETILFEAKSANHTNWLDVKNKGVQVSKPGHYTQMQMYMGRMDLNFALYAMYDKNTSDLYFELVPFDAECFMEAQLTESDVLNMVHINDFSRISTNPSWFECKTCDAKKMCHNGLSPERNCRTCQHSALAEGGKWACTVGNEPVELSLKEQQDGCIAYKLGDKWC